MKAPLPAIGSGGETLAAGRDIDDGRVNLIEADVVELAGVGGECAGAEADVADADAAGWPVFVEEIEDGADTAVRGVVGGGQRGTFAVAELRAVDRGAVQQGELVGVAVWLTCFLDSEGAEKVAA